MNQKTALYDQHVALGAKIIPFAGYEMPVRYTGDVAEHLCVRQKCGLFDVSHMGEFLVKGNKALDLLQYITSNDVAKLPVGKAQYSCLPNGKGGIIDDLIVYHLEPELYLVVVNASNIEKDWNWFLLHNQTIGAELKNLSDKTGLLALSGPTAESVLQPLTSINLSALGYYELAKGTVCGIENILVATTGYTGERTFEIFMPVEHSVFFWNTLLEKGKEFGIQPVGLGARDTLRLEMGYMLYGNDIDDTTSPLEAGLGWITKLDKGSFIDSEYLKIQKSNGIKRKLVAFEMQERAIPRHGYSIAKEGQVIGTVTSGSQSPCLNKGIGLGYVPTEFANTGSSIDILIREKPIPATIVKAPFVKNTSLSKK